MKTEFDKSGLDYWNSQNGKYIVKFKKGDRIEGDNDENNTLPSHVGAFILSNSHRIMNNFSKEINGFFKSSISYRETDSSCREKKIGCVGPIKFIW